MLEVNEFAVAVAQAAEQLIYNMAAGTESVYDLMSDDDRVIYAASKAIEEVFCLPENHEFPGFGAFLSSVVALTKAIVSYNNIKPYPKEREMDFRDDDMEQEEEEENVEYQ